MITESIGGECPICGFNRMFLRYGTSSWFQFDACPKCGFAWGSGDEPEYTSKQVWEAIIDAHKGLLIERKFPINMRGLYKLVMSYDPPFDTDRKTVFNYPKEMIEQWKSRKSIREKVIFT